jgi:hypothetical protein
VFVKVSKRVGAVAIYSPARAIALVTVLVLAIAAVGFFGGRASKSDAKAAPSQPAAASAPATAPAQDSTSTAGTGGADASAPDTTAHAQRHIKRGYRAGAQAAVPGGAAFFKPGEAYIIKVEPGRNGAPFSIGAHTRIDPNFRYRICRGGTRICVVPVGAAVTTPPAPGTAPAAAGGTAPAAGTG